MLSKRFSLDVHRYTTLANHDRYFAQLSPAGLNDILQLDSIILLGSFSAKVECLENEHALAGQL